MAEPVERFSTWLLTGTAAMLALIVVNISSVTNVVSGSCLRWGLALLTISMLSGVITKQFGMAIRNGVALIEAMYAEIQTTEGKEAFQKAEMDSDTFIKAIAKPFLWPFNCMMENGVRIGATDYLNGEKRHIKLFCLQLYASYLQGGLAAIGLLLLVFGIR